MPKLRCQCGCTMLFKPEQSGGIATCPKCSALVRFHGARPALGRLSASPSASSSAAESEAQAHPSFWRLIPQVFQYPLQPNGLAIGLCGVITFTVAHYVTYILSFLLVVGWLADILIYVGLVGFFTGYAMQIMWCSAKGKWEIPEWPDMSNTTSNVFAPFLYLLVGAIVSMSPYVGYHLVAGADAKWSTELELLAGGMIYLPMGLLCVALAGPKALSPLVVLRAIASSPFRYAAPWSVAVILAAVQAFGGKLIDEHLPLPLIWRALQQAVSLYLLFVIARLLGLLYYSSRVRMRWLITSVKSAGV